VGGMGHVSSELNQNCLHGIIPAPIGKARKLGRINHTVSRINTGKVDFADKLDGRRLVRILITAVHFEGVNSVYQRSQPSLC